MTKTCKICHAENRDGAEFCRTCGTSFAAISPALDSAFEQSSSYPAPFDPLTIPDAPDPRTAMQAEFEGAASAPPTSIGFGTAERPPASRRTGLWAGLGVAALVAAVLAWWFLNTFPGSPFAESGQGASTAPAAIAPESQAGPSSLDTTATQPSPATFAPASSAAESSSPQQAPAAATPDSATAPARDLAPSNAGTPPNPVDTDAQRLTAEKKAREKAVHDRAERDARAKAAIEQREQVAARLRAEQAAARKRAEEQRARASTTVAPPVAAPAPAPIVRTVKEICAGRNVISQAICESRECGGAEHAEEAVCKQVRENEERHRN